MISGCVTHFSQLFRLLSKEVKVYFCAMPAKVSVIIVSYNVSALLRSCLLSVLAEDGEVEVIVADNASSDDSVAMIKSSFPQVRLIENKTNVGFSEANNQGINTSSGDYIFLLNPDTELRKSAIEILHNAAEAQNGLAVFGPCLNNSDGTLQKSAWKAPGPFDMIAEALFLHRLFSVSEYPASEFTSTFHPGMMSGAALFFPRALYDKIGGLDPDLFWMEDADFCKRAREAGAELIYLPAAVVVHHSGQSSRSNLKRVIANQLLSKLKYYRKHNGLAVMLFTSFFCWFHIVTRLLLFGISSPFSHSGADKAGAYWFAAGQFFRYLFAGDKSVT